MKVLYFHQHFSTPEGSTGIRSYQMARQLVFHGHQVTMVCGSYLGGNTGLHHPFIKGRRRGIVDGIDIIEFDLSYANADNFFRRIKTFIKFALRSISLAFRESYDIVFATSTPLTAGIPGIVAKWLLNKPFVFEVRDLWPALPKAMGIIRHPILLAMMSSLEWLSYHSADQLIALSPGIVEGIAARRISKQRITMIPNGCDLTVFDVNIVPRRPASIAADDLLVIYGGTHGLANGLDAALDVAAELKRRGRSDIKLLLVGQGKLKAKLQRHATNQELDNIVFHEPIEKDGFARLVAASDIGLQLLANIPAFYYGTSPNKFFDYLASGLPVLNNYPGWVATLICKYQCGFVVPPENCTAFADALVQAADNRDDLKKMAANARRLAKTCFDRSQLAKEWITVLEGVINVKALV